MLSFEAIKAINLANPVKTVNGNKIVKIPYMVSIFSREERQWFPARACATLVEAQSTQAFIQNRFMVSSYDIKLQKDYETVESNLETM